MKLSSAIISTFSLLLATTTAAPQTTQSNKRHADLTAPKALTLEHTSVTPISSRKLSLDLSQGVSNDNTSSDAGLELSKS